MSDSSRSKARPRAGATSAGHRPGPDQGPAISVVRTVVERLTELADLTAQRADLPGHEHLRAHAALYRRDAAWVEAHAEELS